MAIDSMAKVVAAMSAILWAMASCLPTGRPHCTRSAAHLRQISRQSLAVPTEPFGIERRPSLRVVRAILRPLPSSPIRFSAGTRTFLKLITALARALQAHEVAAVLDLHARPVGLDHEGADLLVPGVASHDHEELGEGAVGAPELLAVEDVVPFRRPLGGGHRGAPGRSRPAPRSGRRRRSRPGRSAAGTSS